MWPYGVSATCFIVTYLGVFYAVTAKHCVHSENPNSVRIYSQSHPTIKTHSFLPINRYYAGDDVDIAVFRIDESHRNECELIEYVDLAESTISVQELSESARLFYSGYPYDLNVIDYEKKSIKTQRFIGYGCYSCKLQEGRHKLFFDPDDCLTTNNNLSGSPVFYRPNGKTSSSKLCGMLIESNKYRTHGVFVAIDTVIKFIDTARQLV